ncbi:hypothetical protein ACJX0J_015082 [Zea mays]
MQEKTAYLGGIKAAIRSFFSSRYATGMIYDVIYYLIISDVIKILTGLFCPDFSFNLKYKSEFKLNYKLLNLTELNNFNIQIYTIINLIILVLFLWNCIILPLFLNIILHKILGSLDYQIAFRCIRIFGMFHMNELRGLLDGPVGTERRLWRRLVEYAAHISLWLSTIHITCDVMFLHNYLVLVTECAYMCRY